MKQAAILKALEGHPNAAAILEVLDTPVEPDEMNERRNGYVVGSGDEWLLGATVGDPEQTVHTLAHWQAGWEPEQFKSHQRRAREARERHGLQFLERPHRKGRFKKVGPSVRAKVREQYRAQVEAENNGEEWHP